MLNAILKRRSKQRTKPNFQKTQQ